jgi:hypothetical protein
VFQTKAAAWNIPPANVTSLTTADTNAKTILAVVESGERTAANVVECNEAFKEMEIEARFIKKHFLLLPPLTLADLPMLSLDFAYSITGFMNQGWGLGLSYEEKIWSYCNRSRGVLYKIKKHAKNKTWKGETYKKLSKSRRKQYDCLKHE